MVYTVIDNRILKKSKCKDMEYNATREFLDSRGLR